MQESLKEIERQQDYIPCQINPKKVVEFCRSVDINPNDYWILREVMIRNIAYTAPGLIAAIGSYNREPHHLVVLTTSNVLKQGLSEEDKQLLHTLKARIPSRSLLDHFFGERVKDDRGVRTLDRLLDGEGLDEARKKKVLKKLYIQPTRRGDTELIIAEDDFLCRWKYDKKKEEWLYDHDGIDLQFTILKSGLREFGRVICIRNAPPKDFCNELLRAVR